MKNVFEIGALLVGLVVAIALFQKYSAQLAQVGNLQGLADYNRANADTALMYQGGEDALASLSTWIPTAPYGGN